MLRLIAFFYSAICYLSFLGVFLYAIGFVGNMIVPKAIDSGAVTDFGSALLINLLLLSLFAIQHTVMARPFFKKVWTRLVPESIERATYVLLSNVALALIYWQWRPMTADIWVVESTIGQVALNGLFWVGWLIVLLATFMINHFELFGLRQTWYPLIGKEPTETPFQTTGFYNYVRHPLMLGFLIAFWATPHMTFGHLLFAAVTTGYILVGTWFEERDLVAALGDDYVAYRKRVLMLIPSIPKKRTAEATTDSGVAER
ncbi:MAG: isoprenylcysteine carboxylmethyltransferase family protein [candidate division Zixibacteria bacterium]